MAKRITLIILTFAVAAAIIFTGCTSARKPMTTPGTQTSDRTGGNYNNTRTGMDYSGTNYDNYTKVGDQLGVRDWSNNYRTDMYNNGLNNNVGNNVGLNTATKKSDDIARACEQVQGVENATVVVTGNTCYVGIDMENTTGVANERDIKNAVAQKVRASGKDINTVYVSAEADFMDRLRNVGSGLRNGRPVDAFTTELKEMVNRINPTKW